MSNLKIELSEKDIEKFWKYVDKKSEDECWGWHAVKDGNGYGMLKINGKMHRAHRISWVIHNGDIPEGLCVCHKCDNPGCTNPLHLFLGTHQENMKDMRLKGRANPGQHTGETNGLHKLTECQVKEIREKYIPYKYTLLQLAEEYSVSGAAIHKIIKFKNWKYLGKIKENEEGATK